MWATIFPYAACEDAPPAVVKEVSKGVDHLLASCDAVASVGVCFHELARRHCPWSCKACNDGHRQLQLDQLDLSEVPPKPPLSPPSLPPHPKPPSSPPSLPPHPCGLDENFHLDWHGPEPLPAGDLSCCNVAAGVLSMSIYDVFSADSTNFEGCSSLRRLELVRVAVVRKLALGSSLEEVHLDGVVVGTEGFYALPNLRQLTFGRRDR